MLSFNACTTQVPFTDKRYRRKGKIGLYTQNIVRTQNDCNAYRTCFLDTEAKVD